VLTVRGLVKRYGELTALDGVELDLAPGEICGLLGPNGAGKTTLASIIAGLRRADAGTVTIGGIDALGDGRRARHKLGFAPQELGIYPTLTVRENLTAFGELADLRGTTLRTRITEVGDALELSSLLDRVCRTLSGGEKRRVHTAAALLHRPALLLLDEPTTGVDVATRGRLLEAVRALAAEGTAICYSTHYLPEVEALGASVAIIDRGTMIARGTVADLIAAHGRPSVKILLDGPLPHDLAPLPFAVERQPDRLRITGTDPTTQIGEVLTAMGPAAALVRRIDVLAVSLEGVFLALTGRRFEAQEEDAA
jgi:ABC-2 type transport system ATP-binding protein